MIKRSKILSFVSTLLLCAAFSTVAANWQTPPHDFPTTFGTNGAIASDANGHAFVVYDDANTDQVFASFYNGTVWLPGQLIFSSLVNSLDVAMDDTGTALVIAYVSNGDILSANFNGIVWNSPVPNPVTIITGGLNTDPQVSMNGPNHGVLIWGDSTTGIIGSSFFSGAWSTPINVATGQFNLVDYKVAFSVNGTAVALWSTNTSVLAANYIGGVWQAPVVLDFNVNFSNVSVGIDDNGIAHALWYNAAGDVVTATFNGTWQAPQALSTVAGNYSVAIGVAPGGTAVATWVDSLQTGQSSAFNGTSWSLPFQFASNVDLAGHNTLSVDDNGDALAVWAIGGAAGGTVEVLSARLSLGALVWCPEEVVDDDAGGEENELLSLASTLSSDGTGFALWAPGGEGVTFSASVSLPLAPPTNVTVRACTIKFATQTDRVVIITWSQSTDPTVRIYEVRRNGVLVVVIPSDGPYVFEIHNLCRGVAITDVYTITAIGCGDEESVPVTVVFP